MTQTILRYTFEILIILVVIAIISSFVYNSLTETRTIQDLTVKDLGLTLDSTSISENIQGNYNLEREYIIESKDNILSIKKDENDIPESYSFISEIEDFTEESDNLEIK